MLDFQSLLQGRWRVIWLRHFQVWLKLFVPALLGNFAEPLMFLVALGYGLGHFVGQIDGIPYIAFLASGIVCSSTLQNATFEAQYSAYTRMAVQNTWQAMLAAPLNIQDVVIGEIIWAGTKSLINVSAILIVSALIGAIDSWYAVWLLPILLLCGICFAAMAMVMTAVAKGYDFFMYYWTLIATPLTLLSGVFFPLSELPSSLQTIMLFFPLAHAIELTRPLTLASGHISAFAVLTHLSVILLYTLIATMLCLHLVKRRLQE